MRSKLFFVLFFIVLGLVTLQIPINTLEGSRVTLTLVATLRFLPLIVGVWFFAKKEGRLLVLPALSIIAFNLHPVGRTVWFYSLFWTIPFLMWQFRERSLAA